MSNRRKLKSGAPKERCSFCRRGVGKLDSALRLRTGQIVCPACQQRGELPRLPCGHIALPGSFMISDSDDGSNRQCVQCSPHAGQFGAEKFGLAPR